MIVKACGKYAVGFLLTSSHESDKIRVIIDVENIRKGSAVMKNPCLENLCKMEFVVTNACTGKCKHCSEGSHACSGENIDPVLASKAVESITKEYLKAFPHLEGKFSAHICDTADGVKLK